MNDLPPYLANSLGPAKRPDASDTAYSMLANGKRIKET